MIYIVKYLFFNKTLEHSHLIKWCISNFCMVLLYIIVKELLTFVLFVFLAEVIDILHRI